MTTVLPNPPAEGVPLPAGPFSAWVAELERSVAGNGSSDVPCDGCTACCTSSLYVAIGRDESATLARISEQLLQRVPGAPAGQVMLAPDDQGHCPMLVDGRCSIYEHRPRTCRNYDCRIFAATGVRYRRHEHEAVNRRASRWRFDHPTASDRAEHDAVLAAGGFLDRHGARLPAARDLGGSRRAMLAIALRHLFPSHDGTGTSPDRHPTVAEVRAVLRPPHTKLLTWLRRRVGRQRCA